MVENIKIPPKAFAIWQNLQAQIKSYLEGVLVGMGIEGAIGIRPDDGTIIFSDTTKSSPQSET